MIFLSYRRKQTSYIAERPRKLCSFRRPFSQWFYERIKSCGIRVALYRIQLSYQFIILYMPRCMQMCGLIGSSEAHLGINHFHKIWYMSSLIVCVMCMLIILFILNTQGNVWNYWRTYKTQWMKFQTWNQDILYRCRHTNIDIHDWKTIFRRLQVVKIPIIEVKCEKWKCLVK